MRKTVSQLRARDQLLVAGLSGGTSCEGVDAALFEISGGGEQPLQVKEIASHDEPYSAELRRRVIGAAEGQPLSVEDLSRLHFRVGSTFARTVERLLRQAGRSAEELDLIGSHGQSLVHLPPRMDTGIGATGLLRRGCAFQLGEPAMIAEALRIAVVSDFRARDMAAGGQGAPLGAYVDYLLFSRADRNRAVVNIGGVTHVTYLPAGGQPGQVLAYDSGPGSLVMDSLVQRMTLGRQRLDRDGLLAQNGRVDGRILEELLQNPYFQRPPPKSTGREEFGMTYARRLYERGVQRGVKPSDTLRTATDFTAIVLAQSFQRHPPPQGQPEEIIVSGGGAHNPVLMARLRQEFGPERIHPSDEYGISMKAKQPLVYAVLARETILDRPGNLPSATGADGPRALGQITPP